MSGIAERITSFRARTERTQEEVETLSTELRGADVPTLRESATVLNAPETVERLKPDERGKLLGAHKERLTAIARSGVAGVYSLSPEVMAAHKYNLLKRETAGLFPGSGMDPAILSAKVSRTVETAIANRAKPAPTALDKEKFAAVTQRLIGINSGPDQISEASLQESGNDLEFNAYDKAGFHVMFGRIRVSGDAVYVANLKATHGRNVDDLSYAHGEEKMPGRGNTRAVSEALSAATEAALASGFSALECTPGSNEVAALYAKMGFKTKDGSAPAAFDKMRLDLTDTAAVQQMVFVFTASRLSITDVPKTVSDKILAQGKAQTPPNRTFAPTEHVGHHNFLLEPEAVPATVSP